MSNKKAAYILDGDVKIPINDPSVPEWAKGSTKPSYTASEVGATTVEDVKNIVSNIENLPIISVEKGGTGASDSIAARTNLSALGFVTATCATIEEFWEAVTSTGGYSKILQVAFRIKDTGGWGPLASAGVWYQGFATWQNNPSSETYSTSGTIIIYQGAQSTLYRGALSGNYTSGLVLNWSQIWDSAVKVPVVAGGTGATTAEAARTNLGMRPVSLWGGSMSEDTLLLDYGDYQYYMLRAYPTSDSWKYSTMVFAAQDITTTVSHWRMPLMNGELFSCSLQKVVITDEATGEESVKIQLTLSDDNTGKLSKVWGYN